MSAHRATGAEAAPSVVQNLDTRRALPSSENDGELSTGQLPIDDPVAQDVKTFGLIGEDPVKRSRKNSDKVSEGLRIENEEAQTAALNRMFKARSEALKNLNDRIQIFLDSIKDNIANAEGRGEKSCQIASINEVSFATKVAYPNSGLARTDALPTTVEAPHITQIDIENLKAYKDLKRSDFLRKITPSKYGKYKKYRKRVYPQGQELILGNGEKQYIVTGFILCLDWS